MAKENIKERNERNFIIKKIKCGKGYILQRLMASGTCKSLASAGTEFRVHASNLLLCDGALVARG